MTAPSPGGGGSAGRATPVSALAPFSYDWIGGDIRGLSALAGTLYQYVPGINGAMSVLGGKVNALVSGCLWTGSAATAFERAYGEDAKAAHGLAILVEDTGEVIDALAVALSRIESDLEQAAAKAKSHGAPVGPDGRPAGVCIDGTTRAAKEAANWLAWYEGYYRLCIDAAQKARTRAAAGLEHLPFPEIIKNGSATDWEGMLQTLASDTVNVAGFGQGALAGMGKAATEASGLLKSGDLDTMYALSHNPTLGTLAASGASGATELAGDFLLGAGAVLTGINVYQQTHNPTEAVVDAGVDTGISVAATSEGATQGAEYGGEAGAEIGSLVEPGGGTVVGAGIGAIVGAGVGFLGGDVANRLIGDIFG